MKCLRCGGKGTILGKQCILCAPKASCMKLPGWSPGPRRVCSEGRGVGGGRIPRDIDSGDYSADKDTV